MAPPETFIGVDVGGTKVAAAAVEAGEVRERVERPTPKESAEALIDAIADAARELAGRGSAPVAVGVGVPSQVEFATGTAIASIHVPLQGVPLRPRLAERLGLPVYVDNDANVAALAEAHAAADEAGGGPLRDLVMLTLGTGVGGGIVAGGEILRGADGLGAELGHMTVDADGPECPGSCPNRGCLEAFASGTALERDATELGREKPGSRLGEAAARGDGRVSAREVVAAARAGDPDATTLLARLGTFLGVGIASLANALQPERIAIGGGLSQAADLFLDRAREEAAARALPAIWERVELATARTGADAGTIGAAALALQEHRRSGDTARR